MQQGSESKKEFSTTNLAKELKISTNDMFQQLLESGLIVRSNTGWDLTHMGKSKGGVYKNSEKFGRFIIWPESIKVELERNSENEKPGMITATSIGKTFNISATRINSILSELGWIKKDAIKGWHLTELGKRLGGVESKYATSGVSFVRWPEKIIKNEILVTNICQASGDVPQAKEEAHNLIKSDPTEFREKFRPEYRAKDGHYVRSKSEIIIDNTLYDYKIVHAYERKLPVEENIYCDFYIPNKGGVYIEYWGLDEEKYLANKKRKLEIYNKYNFNLIELFEKDVSNLEDTLPAKLLYFGIGVEQ